MFKIDKLAKDSIEVIELSTCPSCGYENFECIDADAGCEYNGKEVDYNLYRCEWCKQPIIKIFYL